MNARAIIESILQEAMTGTLVDTKKGFAVETEFVTDDGSRYIQRRLVNGSDGRLLLGPVRYSGHNTWSGASFTVSASEYPDSELGEELPPLKKVAKRIKKRRDESPISRVYEP